MVEISDKAKLIDLTTTIIDPSEFVLRWYDFKSDGKAKVIEIGRGTKKFTGQVSFQYFSLVNKNKSLLSQGDLTANFCIGTCGFIYGKDKEKIRLVAYGPPARVLDAVLANTDSFYHEDIIDWHSSQKLKYLSETIGKDDKNAEEKLKEGIAAILDGFEAQQKAAGKKKPQFFTKQAALLKSARENIKRISDKTGVDVGDIEIPKFLQKEVKENPFAFKSAATKEVINEGVYKYLTPAEILTQRIAQTNTSIPQLAKALGFDISTVYHHVRGTRDVDRKAALRYAHFFNCDPADILFPPIKIALTGRSDLIKKDGQVDIDYTKSESVLCPRDFYSNAREIKAIKITSPSSVYNDHIAYYYYTNKKETDCENKICFIGVSEKGFMDEPYTNYYIGIYENYRGETKILNPDPYRSKETLLTNPEIKFITPIIAFVNVDKVKFSPIVDIKYKEINANEKLKKLEKELEIAEQHWWIENQKLSGKQVTTKGKGKALESMYKNLRKKRLEVNHLRANVTRSSFDNETLDERIKQYQESLFEELEAQKAVIMEENKKRA